MGLTWWEFQRFATPAPKFDAPPDVFIQAPKIDFVSSPVTLDASPYADDDFILFSTAQFNFDGSTNRHWSVWQSWDKFDESTQTWKQFIFFPKRVPAGAASQFVMGWVLKRELKGDGKYRLHINSDVQLSGTPRDKIIEFTVTGTGAAPPTPTPTPEPPPAQTITMHEIEIGFLNPFGVGQKLAEKAAQQEALIRKILPANFTYTHYNLQPNSVTLNITEVGNQLLPILLIYAIVATVIAIIGFLFTKFLYRENVIMKATLVAKAETKAGITAVIDDPNLTDAQKIEKIKALLLADPDIVIGDGNGDGFGFGDIADTLKFAIFAMIGIALLGALKPSK